MTTQEALLFTLSKVDELRELGIEVINKPYSFKDNPETIVNYNKPENIKHNLWIQISFKTKNKIHFEKIREAMHYLRICGITFDTGGCNGQRDWELDWSFSYNPGEDNPERGFAQDAVEDILQNNFICK